MGTTATTLAAKMVPYGTSKTVPNVRDADRDGPVVVGDVEG